MRDKSKADTPVLSFVLPSTKRIHYIPRDCHFSSVAARLCHRDERDGRGPEDVLRGGLNPLSPGFLVKIYKIIIERAGFEVIGEKAFPSQAVLWRVRLISLFTAKDTQYIFPFNLPAFLRILPPRLTFLGISSFIFFRQRFMQTIRERNWGGGKRATGRKGRLVCFIPDVCFTGYDFSRDYDAR